jgi:hypothetical protein
MPTVAARWSLAAALLLLGLPDPVQASMPAPDKLCGGQSGLPNWFAPGVYSGRLGPQQITLQLITPAADDDEVGAYAYAGRAASLNLRGAQRGGALVLAEQVWSGPAQGQQTSGCLSLTRPGAASGGAALSGTWRSPAGKMLPLNLTRLDPARVPLRLLNTPGVSKLRAEDPLAFLKLNTVWPRTASTVTEPLSGVNYPRVPLASAALAGALQDRQLLAAASALDCATQLGGAYSGEGFTLQAQITRLSPRLVSLRESAQYYCGGAHPDAFEDGVLLDRRSGRRLSLTAIWPGLTPARQLALYLAQYPASEAECRTVVREQVGAPGAGSFTGWLSRAGLVLSPTFLPHAAADCAQTLTLSYAALRPQAKASGAYFRDLYPR